EALQIDSSAGHDLKLTNPYPDELVSFIQIWLKKATRPAKPPGYSASQFNIEDKNRLLPVFKSRSSLTSCFIGKFDLRSDGVYQCADKQPDVFAVAVTGAFEFQNRLLQAGDALRLEKVQSEIEFEALSQDAILMLIETS
ncbi:MAG: hypothetical protein QM664_05645, partial [Flavihumibacter sp.]